MCAGVFFLLLFLFFPHLFDLAFTMARIDLFAFGGGFAALPLMFHEVVDVHAWLDSATFINGLALGQVTPGPIVITATFVGFLTYGFWGGVVATIAIFTPSFLFVIGTVPYYDRLRNWHVVPESVPGNPVFVCGTAAERHHQTGTCSPLVVVPRTSCDRNICLASPGC